MMAVGFMFLVTVYCTQSGLSTKDYADAAQGLKRTKWLKKHTYIFRAYQSILSSSGNVFATRFSVGMSVVKGAA